MIDLQTKIHDKFTLEFKTSFKTKPQTEINNFTLNTWVFVPHSLDVNPRTYHRDDFYKDLYSNSRLITPVYLLRDIVKGDKCPLEQLRSAMQNMASEPTDAAVNEYEYQLKMFSAIYKSAIRDQLKYILAKTEEGERLKLIGQLLLEISEIGVGFRSLRAIIEAHTVGQVEFNYFSFGDEFMVNLTEKELFGFIEKLDNSGVEKEFEQIQHQIAVYLSKEKIYKKEQHYRMPEKSNGWSNSELIFRFGALKKYIESDLFLNAHKKRDGVMAEQVYMSIAAGLSMVVATAIAFSFQQKYGNFTMPFFVALVVSYMLKDRIKELTRFYFTHKMNGKYYDSKTTFSVKENEVGWSKEGFDFIPEMNIPKEVLSVRNRLPIIQADNRHSKEKVFLYKKYVRINRVLLRQNSVYNIDGIVEIIRFNVSTFMKKMDNPQVPLYTLDDDNKVGKIMGTKMYFLNFIFHCKHDELETFTRIRVGFNREGIQSVVKME